MALLGDLVALRTIEAQAQPPFPQALAALDSDAVKLRFDAEEVEPALAADAEAERLMDRGFYHLAVPLINRTVTLLHRQLGPNALQTLRARGRRVRLLSRRCRYADALAEINSVVKIATASPALGPEHPNTLTNRYLLAEVLYNFGRSAEALPIISEVAEAMAASPALGPEHPNPLACRYLLAQVLGDLGRAAEGLTKVETEERHTDSVKQAH